MNAVEIDQAVTELFELPFDRDEFAFQFLSAFGNPDTAIRRLRAGNTNKSNIENGVLQRNNIHIAISPAGKVLSTLEALRNSPETSKAKAKFILSTDGDEFQAEDLSSGETIACDYHDFANHFGFFLPLAGISTVKQIRDNPIDIQATSRLNRLYVELLKTNEDWAERRHDMNQFIGRLIFCFFAEDTDIFDGDDLFIKTIEQMSDSRSDNTDHVLQEIFRAMDIKYDDRAAAKLPRWASAFPYVNGGLFADNRDVPKFTRAARSYLLHAGSLNWKEINPDIFGSMIQAVADEEERGALGMHYTSVPNILKVLNPLFLDDLRGQLDEAGDNGRKLLNLKKRMSRMRVFDPACGSGNFLVIAYKEMRAIEFKINQLRGEVHLKSEIPLSNFRGIEIREFPAEIARLSLIIAEFQCDVLYRGQKDALRDFLPLDSKNWIVCGNALRLDWLSICPPTGTVVKHAAEDLFHTPLDQHEIDFENEGGETFICGNPPYLGSKWQSSEQKSDMISAWKAYPSIAKTCDFVTGWIAKYADFQAIVNSSKAAFVVTNSICQGQQAADLWPFIFNKNIEITFAHTDFRWKNLASHNAVVVVVIVGLAANSSNPKRLYSEEMVRVVETISPYLTPGHKLAVTKTNVSISSLPQMSFGNMPRDGGHLILERDELRAMSSRNHKSMKFIRRFVGSEDMIKGKLRYCLWIKDAEADEAKAIAEIEDRIQSVKNERLASKAESTRKYAQQPHKFVQIQGTGSKQSIICPRVSSERREYLPTDLADGKTIVADSAFALYDAPLWSMALIASRLHLTWIGTVCGKLKTDFRYSNTLGWNTFPVPKLTEKNKQDLTKCAEDILLAREAHFPATIADLYDPEAMPETLRAAHDRNDEVLERIYIGRRFKNDTERLEKLFELYTKMTTAKGAA